MARGLTLDQRAAWAARVKRPALLVHVDLPSPIRGWTGRGILTTAGGVTWNPIGTLGIVQDVSTERSATSNQISISVNGIPIQDVDQGVIKRTRAQRYQGASMSIYVCLIALDADVPVSDPIRIWKGFADTLQFGLGSTFSATLSGEHYSSLLRRGNSFRTTLESHNLMIGSPETPDLFFEYNSRSLAKQSEDLVSTNGISGTPS